MGYTMRALSVRQPWAHLIATGRKTIEVRTWSVSYRGPLAIVSSKSACDHHDARAHGVDPRACALGCVVCVVELVDVRPGIRSDARGACCDARGAFAWVLARPVPCEPVKVRGKVSLWYLDDALAVPAGALSRSALGALQAVSVAPGVTRKRLDNDDDRPFNATEKSAMLKAWSRDQDKRKGRL